VILINLFYGLPRSLLGKAAVFLLIAFLLASPSFHFQTSRFLAKELGPPKEGNYYVIKEPEKGGLLPSAIFLTRETLWSRAWDGFLKSPAYGWGFGLNEDSPKTWVFGATAIGIIRDTTNDILFILEGCGLIGLLGYLFLIYTIIRQAPSRAQMHKLRHPARFRIIRTSWLAEPTGSPKSSSSGSLRGLPGPEAKGKQREEAPGLHSQIILYVLSICLWVLFMVDGTAFSPGSLISVLFWMATVGAAALRETPPDLPPRTAEENSPTARGGSPNAGNQAVTGAGLSPKGRNAMERRA
jgi:O-antigen ligase